MHLVRFLPPLQPLVFFILLLTGCTTPTSEVDLDRWIPEGFYHVTSEIINQDNLARVTHKNQRIQVQLLGDFDGGFTMAPLPNGELEIVTSRMDYPGLKRSFKGEGRIQQPGVAMGTAITWLKSAGPVSRNHRKGTWSLRPATPQEVERYQQKQKQLEFRQNRANS